MMEKPQESDNSGKETTLQAAMEFFQERKPENEYWAPWWSGKSDTTLNHIKALIGSGQPDAIPVAVGQWAKWVSAGVSPALQEMVAQEMGKEDSVMIFLASKLARGLDRGEDWEVWDWFIKEAALEDGDPPKKVRAAWSNDVEWEEYRDRYRNNKEIQDKWEAGQIRLRLRIAQLLAQMCENRKSNGILQIDGERNEQVVGSLASHMAKEGDLDIRVSIAEVLRIIDTVSAKRVLVDASIKDFQKDYYWLWRLSDQRRPPTLQEVSTLVQDAGLEAMFALVSQWAKWIAVRYEPTLQELTAQKMSQTSASVQPLIDKLATGLDEKIDSDVIESLTYDAVLEAGETRKVVDDALTEPIGSSWDKLKEEYKKQRERKWKAAQLKVRQRIAGLLAEMSGTSRTEEIDKELKKHAIGPLVRILNKEGDLEIRHSIACVLKNLSTTDALEAMVDAVAGEARRRDTLDKYYLEPSRERSKETENILKEVADQAKRTLKLTHWLNVAVIVIGLGIVVAGLSVSILSSDAGTRVTAALSAFGGFAGVIYYFITQPLQHIQNGVAYLTEVDAAFASFISELNLNDTFIQSQYLANGILSDEEIRDTVQRIQKARSSTMEIVEAYTKIKDKDQVSYISSLYPGAGQEGDKITIKGRFISSTAEENGKRLIIAIDHIPTLAEVTPSKNEREVTFKVPADPVASYTEKKNIWISVVVDGVETNARTFQANPKKQQEQTPSITVISPKGGENWKVGATQTITWTSVGLNGDVKIELSLDGGKTWTITIAATTPNTGSMNWMVRGSATTQARIRVSSIASPNVSGASIADFAIE